MAEDVFKDIKDRVNDIKKSRPEADAKKKIAILVLGGSFHPIHLGHLDMFRQGREHLLKTGYDGAGIYEVLILYVVATKKYLTDKVGGGKPEYEYGDDRDAFRIDLCRVAIGSVTGQSSDGIHISKNMFVHPVTDSDSAGIGSGLKDQLASDDVIVFGLCGSDKGQLVKGTSKVDGLIKGITNNSIVIARNDITDAIKSDIHNGTKGGNPKAIIIDDKSDKNKFKTIASSKIRPSLVELKTNMATHNDLKKFKELAQQLAIMLPSSIIFSLVSFNDFTNVEYNQYIPYRKDIFAELLKDIFKYDSDGILIPGVKQTLVTVSTTKVSVDPKPKTNPTKIEFLQMTTAQALYYANTMTTSKPGTDKIFALNFANANSIGGGVRNGAIAQEETLCLQSNQLYRSLKNMTTTLGDLSSPIHLEYGVNWGETNWHSKYFISENPIEFVTTDEFSFYPRTSVKYAGKIITAAAPDYGREVGDIDAIDVTKKATTAQDTQDLTTKFTTIIRSIILESAKRGCDTLILGAWGCGAFAPNKTSQSKLNYINLVAGIFRAVIDSEDCKDRIPRIIFPIPDSPTYDPFKAAFFAGGGPTIPDKKPLDTRLPRATIADFVDAHNGVGYTSYAVAKKDLDNCIKDGDWIWYIIPSDLDKSTSTTSEKFKITNRGPLNNSSYQEPTVTPELFMANNVLRQHYVEIITLIWNCAQNLVKDGKSKSLVDALKVVMGKDIDKEKLISSAGVFGEGIKTNTNNYPEFDEKFKQIIAQIRALGVPPSKPPGALPSKPPAKAPSLKSPPSKSLAKAPSLKSPVPGSLGTDEIKEAELVPEIKGTDDMRAAEEALLKPIKSLSTTGLKPYIKFEKDDSLAFYRCLTRGYMLATYVKQLRTMVDKLTSADKEIIHTRIARLWYRCAPIQQEDEGSDVLHRDNMFCFDDIIIMECDMIIGMLTRISKWAQFKLAQPVPQMYDMNGVLQEMPTGADYFMHQLKIAFDKRVPATDDALISNNDASESDAVTAAAAAAAGAASSAAAAALLAADDGSGDAITDSGTRQQSGGNTGDDDDERADDEFDIAYFLKCLTSIKPYAPPTAITSTSANYNKVARSMKYDKFKHGFKRYVHKGHNLFKGHTRISGGATKVDEEAALVAAAAATAAGAAGAASFFTEAEDADADADACTRFEGTGGSDGLLEPLKVYREVVDTKFVTNQDPAMTAVAYFKRLTKFITQRTRRGVDGIIFERVTPSIYGHPLLLYLPFARAFDCILEVRYIRNGKAKMFKFPSAEEIQDRGSDMPVIRIFDSNNYDHDADDDDDDALTTYPNFLTNVEDYSKNFTLLVDFETDGIPGLNLDTVKAAADKSVKNVITTKRKAALDAATAAATTITPGATANTRSIYPHTAHVALGSSSSSSSSSAPSPAPSSAPAPYSAPAPPLAPAPGSNPAKLVSPVKCGEDKEITEECQNEIFKLDKTGKMSNYLSAIGTKYKSTKTATNARNVVPSGSATIIKLSDYPSIKYTSSEIAANVKFILQAATGSMSANPANDDLATYGSDALISTVFNCLYLANKNGVDGIIFPMIGASIFVTRIYVTNPKTKVQRLITPDEIIERLMMGAVQFLEKYSPSTIKTIGFCAFNSDAAMMEKFRAKYNSVVVNKSLQDKIVYIPMSNAKDYFTVANKTFKSKSTINAALVNAANTELKFGGGISAEFARILNVMKPDISDTIDKAGTEFKNLFHDAYSKYLKVVPTVTAKPIPAKPIPAPIKSGGKKLRIMTFNTCWEALGSSDSTYGGTKPGINMSQCKNNCKNNIADAIIEKMKAEYDFILLQEMTYEFDNLFLQNGDSKYKVDQAITNSYNTVSSNYEKKHFNVGHKKGSNEGGSNIGILIRKNSPLNLDLTAGNVIEKNGNLAGITDAEGNHLAFCGNRPYMILVLKKEKIIVINVHYPKNDGGKACKDENKKDIKRTELAARILASAMTEITKQEVKFDNTWRYIICGDFNNTDPTNYVTPLIKTITGTTPVPPSLVIHKIPTCDNRAIDHIFTNFGQPLVPGTNYHVYKHNPALPNISGLGSSTTGQPYFSDHLPVYAEIDI